MANFRAFSSAALAAAGLAAAVTASLPALAQQQPQQGQEWFVPGQQRPAGQAPAGQRPAQPAQPGQAQRPPAGPPPARAAAPAALPAGQQPPAAIIGIVDIPEIQRVSTAFSAVREEIERRRQRLNDDLQREQNNWRQQQQDLANQRASMPAEQLRTKERELQDRITDSQRIFRERSRAIEQVTQSALVEIEQALSVVIRQVAASRNINMLLPRPLVIYNEAPFDMTEEIAQQFNRVLRSVSIPPEPAEGAAPAAPGPAPAAAPRPAQGQRQQQR